MVPRSTCIISHALKVAVKDGAKLNDTAPTMTTSLLEHQLSGMHNSMSITSSLIRSNEYWITTHHHAN